MKHTTWGWVGVCALTLSALAPQLALACPDGDKKPSDQLCPGDDGKKPSERACPGDDGKKPS